MSSATTTAAATTTATTAAATATTAVADDSKKTSKDLFVEIRQAQIRNGLRTDDYSRYASYCTRKIHRARSATRTTCGRGRYHAKEITQQTVDSDPRSLEVLLFQAERCWALWMLLRPDATEGGAPRSRFHGTRRLVKAVQHSEALESLCKESAESLSGATVLQAVAYAAWMKGNLMKERRKWEEAMQRYLVASGICEQLSNVGSRESREVCRRRVEELEPNLRFCSRKCAGATGASPGPAVTPDLQAMLDQVAADEVRRGGETTDEVMWQGRSVRVKNAHAKEALAMAGAKIASAASAARTPDRAIADLGEAIVKFNAALGALREEESSLNAKKCSPAQAEDRAARLSEIAALKDYVAATRQVKEAESLLLLIRTKRQVLSVEDGGVSSEGAATVHSKPEELVRLYDSAMDSLTKAQTIYQAQSAPAGQAVSVQSAETVELCKQLTAQVMSLRALRCWCLSLSYLHARKWGEAATLIERTAQHCTDARRHQDLCHSSSQLAELRSEIGEVEKQLKVYSCVVRARAAADSLQPSSSAAPEPFLGGEAKTVLESLDDWSHDDSRRLAPALPAFEAIPCRPTFFDLAADLVQFPSLESRLESRTKKGGFFSFWQ